MEKAILRVVEEGKGTQQPLLEQVPEAVLNGLTDGQKKATTLVLGTTDQFIGIQGYAGVGKTTQLKAVISALETLPADVRPVMTGLAPTHQAVKEMSDVGVRAQTIKSFVVEHDQATAAGEKPDYKGQVFLIDESSMAGNQDTAALFQAIASGGGRAVSMGDIDQFEAVDVGAPFKLMQERSPMDVAIMKQIVRQKDLQLRGAVHDIIDNRIDAALQRIETQPADRVARSASATLPGSAIQETETPVNDIVADWTDRTPEARSRTLIITQLNADRRAVNAGIHAVLAARGELGEKAITVPVLDKITHTRHEFNKTDAWERGHKIASYYRENISGTKLERPELGRLLMDSHHNDILLVEQIDRLTRLSNSDWMTLKKQIEQHELRIVSLDVPTSWQALSDKDPSQADPITRAVITAINNMLIDLMAAMSHKDWLSRRQRQKQGIERAHTIGKYRGKQADQERHQKVLYYRQVKKLSIRETADATGYSASQVCRIQALHKNNETA